MLFFLTKRQLHSIRHHSENISKIVFTGLEKGGKQISEFGQDLLHLLVNIYQYVLIFYLLLESNMSLN